MGEGEWFLSKIKMLGWVGDGKVDKKCFECAFFSIGFVANFIRVDYLTLFSLILSLSLWGCASRLLLSTIVFVLIVFGLFFLGKKFFEQNHCKI